MILYSSYQQLQLGKNRLKSVKTLHLAPFELELELVFAKRSVAALVNREMSSVASSFACPFSFLNLIALPFFFFGSSVMSPLRLACDFLLQVVKVLLGNAPH